MVTVSSIKSSNCSVESISKYQQLLKQNNFIYLETEDPNFEWIKFAKLVTDKELMLQYGKEIFHVRWERELINFSDARGKKPVLPHTEASDYPEPPKYMALWCKQPAACGGGMTTLAYVEGFLKTLTEAQRKQLMETEHYFGATRGVHASRTKGAIHPILSFSDDNKPILRFSYNYIKHGDYSPDPDNLNPFDPGPFLSEVAEQFLEYYEQNHMAIRMEKYSCLLWDNRCVIHARSTYSDPNRQLERIFLG